MEVAIFRQSSKHETSSLFELFTPYKAQGFKRLLSIGGVKKLTSNLHYTIIFKYLNSNLLL